MQFSTSNEPIVREDFEIIPSQMCVIVNGEPKEVTYGMISALYMMAAQPGRVFERREMIGAIYGHDHPSGERSLDKLICLLRRKTGIKSIKCVRGVGYKVLPEKNKTTLDGAMELAKSLFDVLED